MYLYFCLMLKVHDISKRYGQQLVLQNIGFEVPVGSTFTILGQSGCGKTTLLKVLAGLEGASSGMVHFNGQDILALPARKRSFVYLYQEPLLFPHLNVFENLAFGLRLQGLKTAVLRPMVVQMLEQLGLAPQSQQMPHTLSGGQRQRVSFGRALLIKPRVLLLDEPFGALDTATRTTMQQLFGAITEQSGITSVFVTHDLKEALTTASVLGYMDKGTLTVYKDRARFFEDERTGARQEQHFWQHWQTPEEGAK